MTNQPDEPEFARYLVSIAQTRELTSNEEREVCDKIAAWRDIAAELREGRDTTSARREELELIAQDGARAQDQLMDSYLRLVVSIATRYRRGTGIPMMELVRAGNVGLKRAADRYDPSRGLRFATYATWWVRQEITIRCAEARP